VLYVGCDDVADMNVLGLHASEPAEMGGYAALSYCWGGFQQVTSTTAKLEQYQNRLDFRSFPKTIHDALTVTRSLGIPYLWVDALCILQDDEDDKAREIQKMGDVYSNAMITISAASAR
jgi:hypothetical protein